MAINHDTKADPAYTEALDALVKAEGASPYAPFFVAGEGRRMPNGLEETSGYVVDTHGRVFSFWTGWDAERGKMVFRHWDAVEPERDWLEDEEYREALDKVGRTP
jgi:hypothetical protein